MAKKGTPAKPAVKPTTAAPAVHAGRSSALLDTRVVYCGDNLEQLAKLPNTCVDLIYIDYMRPRCVQLARVLEKTGSFYFYFDWHASDLRSSLKKVLLASRG